jgi:NAD(P)-dependent dehydrogenase (short-subunit alcohol dehydrogenase family)
MLPLDRRQMNLLRLGFLDTSGDLVGLLLRSSRGYPDAEWEPMQGTRKAQMEALTADRPLGRFGLPEEVAALAALLASDECSYIIGTDLNIGSEILTGSIAHSDRR